MPIPDQDPAADPFYPDLLLFLPAQPVGHFLGQGYGQTGLADPGDLTDVFIPKLHRYRGKY